MEGGGGRAAAVDLPVEGHLVRVGVGVRVRVKLKLRLRLRLKAWLRARRRLSTCTSRLGASMPTCGAITAGSKARAKAQHT